MVAEPESLIEPLLTLADYGIPPDVQELLLRGNPDRGIRPGALSAIITAALDKARTEAVAREREACAAEAERIGIRWAEDSDHPKTSRAVGKEIAAAIRAQGDA